MEKYSVFIVTTRHYPVENGDYQPINLGYHDQFGSDIDARKAMLEDSRASWQQRDSGYSYDKPLPIKRREYNNAIVYVAPCLGSEEKNIITSDVKAAYITSILQSVCGDLQTRKINEYEAYLFVHDFDFGKKKDGKMTKEDYDSPDCLGGSRVTYSEYHEKLLGELNNIQNKGYYYQHTSASLIFNFVKFIIGEEYNKESMNDLQNDFNVLWNIFCDLVNKTTPNQVTSTKQEKQPVESPDKASIKKKITEFINNTEDSCTLPVGIKLRKHSWKKRTPENSFKQLITEICGGDPASGDTKSHQFAEINTKDYIVPVINIFEEPLDDIIDKTDVRFGNFFDSSIWNYSLIKDSKFDEQLDGIINEIIGYTLKHYYEFKVSREFIYLNLNLFSNSHLSGSHAEHVVPFLFHSESKLKEKVQNKYVKNEEKNFVYRTGSFAHKWRILLLDDHVLSPMNLIGNEGTTKEKEPSRIKYIDEDKTPDKLRIISDDLRLLYPEIKIGYVKSDDGDKPIYDELTNKSVDKDESYDIVFYCFSSVCKAISALESHRFEIVLLDYLLGEKDDGTREYSYELLKKLEIRYKENEEENKADLIFGPHRRLYFSFISAFTTAVNERLLAEGLHKSEKFWHIADGACPTNTPYLFLYNLLHLMNKRVEDMGLHKLSDISKDKFANSWIKENIINEIYGKEEDEGKKVKVRQNANETFDEVLSLLYHYKKLLDDVHNTDNVFNSTGSVLATDFVKKNPNLGGFLEHLTQLVYLTAFGTVRQWPEMWEEYQFISSIIGPQQKVEEYIMKLKSNNI